MWSNNVGQGSATIIQQRGHDVRCDSTAVIQANANYGYHFDHWSNGSIANPDTITLIGDSTVAAFFERNTYHLTAEVNNVSLGSITLPLGDSALYQDTLMVVASPISHHHVAGWQGATRVSATRDTAWVKMLSNCTVTCNFSIDTYYVNVVPNDLIRGSVSGSGEYEYGTPCTVEAYAYTGYTFYGWSNGVEANPYTFVPVEDITLTAIFLSPDEMAFTVTISSNDPTMGSATVNGAQSYTTMSGETATLMATANSGYRFLRWNDDNTDDTRIITVTSDTSFIAFFEPTNSINDFAHENIIIYSRDGRIVIEGTEDEMLLFDVLGRRVRNEKLATGVYFVKVGSRPTRKVIVRR